MKRCPACGVRNLDSDTYCFNCDEPLAVAATGAAVPAMDMGSGTAVAPAPTAQQDARVAPSEGRMGLVSIFLSNLLTKLVLLVIALGLFFLVSIVAIWVAYDNLALALVAFGVGALGFLIAMLYPDARTGLRTGSRSWLVALVADIVFLAITVFPVLYYLASKGYIAGVFEWLKRFYWTLAPTPLLGALTASIASLFSRHPE